MVMLASYESLVALCRHCDLFTFTVEKLVLLLKAKMKLHSLHVSCDEPDPGLLQTLGFSTGFANGHYKHTHAMSSASLGLLHFESVDPRNTVLMIPPSPYSLEGEDQGTQMRKVANTVKIASLDTKMMK